MSENLRNDTDTFKQLLLNSEDWLMNKVVWYAIKHGFSKYTSTLQEAWRLSIHGLSESLMLFAESCQLEIPELNPDYNYLEDPASEFGISEAQKHRERGISISMFMGLMKYYRQSYLDLFEASGLEMNILTHCKLFTERCFDRIEIAFNTEWSLKSEKELITELQLANRILTNEKNKYLTIFESFYSPVILLNDEKKIINLNQSASKLFTGIPVSGAYYYREEKDGKILTIFNDKITDFINSSLSELSFETYLDTGEGERFFKVKFKKMLDISAKFKGIIIILDDLTERKEMETQYEIAKSRAEEADHLKTAFLANMSHEIRTPMNAIIGFSDLLLNDAITADNRNEYLKLIQKSGNNLLRIIEDIIDVAKIESKQITIHPIQFNISELLNELYSIFDGFIKQDDEKDVHLILNTDDANAHLTLLTDPSRLKQIFTNLLSNALKFTNKGYVEFGYNTVDSNNAYFYVKDTGIGIPQDKQTLIFDRFIQIADNYSKDYGGTGLGLTITKNIVDLMGGSIWVESEPGVGTTFHFVIPINYINENLPQKPTLQPTNIKKKLSFSKNTILIAEDEELNYYYLFEILKKTGVKILWAKNGLEAINLVESNPDIDLVLMDIKMPEINGLEAIKYLKAIRPGLPVIAQTAFVMDDDRNLCLNSGCIDFISKPIKASLLLEMIEKYIGNNIQANKKSEIKQHN